MFGLLLFTTLTVAAPKIVGDHEIKPGGFASLRIEGAGKTVLWDVYPEPVQVEEIAGVLVFTGNHGTRYLAVATVIDFKAESAAKVRHWVTFGGSPEPIPPGPGPSPIPGPVDPLVKALRDAAAKDSYPRIRFADLSDRIKVVVGRIDRHETGGDIKADCTTTFAGLGKVKAPNIVAILAKESEPLEVLFPTDETPATPEKKEAAKQVLLKIAVALLEAAR